MNIRVLNIVPDLQVGGVQRVILRHSAGLKGFGVDSSVCCIGGLGPLAAEFEREGISVHVVRFRSRLDPWGLWRLRRLIVKGGYHVVQPHMYAASVAANIATLWLRGIANVNVYHSIRPVSNAGQAKRVWRTRNTPDAFVAVSEAVAEAIRGLGVPADRVRVIYNGVPVPSEAAPFPGRKSGDPLELMWGGRFVRQKRVGFLIDVAEECRREGVPFRMRLFGDGPLHEKMQQEVKSRGLTEWVTFPGVSHTMGKDLASSDLFLLASEREGFPVTILEAAAQGRGMILSDIAPHHEFLAGTGAGMIPGDDPKKWCAVLKELSADRGRIERMGREAFARAQGFSLPVICGQYHALYRSILAGMDEGKRKGGEATQKSAEEEEAGTDEM